MIDEYQYHNYSEPTSKEAEIIVKHNNVTSKHIACYVSWSATEHFCGAWHRNSAVETGFGWNNP